MKKPTSTPKPFAFIAAFIVVILAVVIWSQKPERVSVMAAHSRSITVELIGKGQLKPKSESDVICGFSGTVGQVLIHPGMTVSTNQVIFTVSNQSAQTALDKAEADLFAARQRVLELTASPLAAVPENSENDSSTVRVSSADQLRKAKQRLDAVLDRFSEQHSRSQADLNQAEQAAAHAQTEYQRCQTLYANDAISRSVYEHARNRVRETQAIVTAARTNMNESPNNDHEISAAKAQLAYAEAQYKASGTAHTPTAGVNKSPADSDELKAAQVRVSEAVRKVAAARTGSIIQAISAPINGELKKLTVNLGSQVKSGMVVGKIVDTINPVIVATVYGDHIREIKAGQWAAVVSPTAKELTWEAKVTGILPYPPNGVKVTLQPTWLPSFCKMNMAVDVSIATHTRQLAVFIPGAACIPVGNGDSVYLVQNGRVKKTPITVVKRQHDGLYAAGIVAGSHVILHPQKIRVGQRVTPRIVTISDD